MTPIIDLTSNQPPARFYRGGEQIRGFRSTAAAGDHVPEDWVGSTTTLFGERRTGLTALPDGRLLVDLITADPLYWLGPDHYADHGSDVMLLVKLLDAGQRLPVHLHPDRGFARQHLGRAHGKAEAWYILNGGTVHLGFTRDIGREELEAWVDGQDVDGLLAAMHRVAVEPGDSVYVPPGVPHAIGEGVFLVEVQEPEDLSILLEWEHFDIDGTRDGHLGLGFTAALTATDRRGLSPHQVEALLVRQGSGDTTLVPEASPFFRAERMTVRGSLRLEAGFSILVVTEGHGVLTSVQDPPVTLVRGQTVLVPAGVGPLVLEGELSVVRCRPPRAPATA